MVEPDRMRCVLCLGNELISDDGAGIRVGRVLESIELPADVQVQLRPAVGLDLLDLVLGAGELVVVDAMTTGRPPGTVCRWSLEQLVSLAQPPYGSHAVGLPELMQLAARLYPAREPPPVEFVGIEAQEIDRFGLLLSAPVAAAVPEALQHVLERLGVSAEVRRRGARLAVEFAVAPAPWAAQGSSG
jgi:hydrogenase maturation protease